MFNPLVVAYLAIVALRVALEVLNLRHQRKHGNSISEELVDSHQSGQLEKISNYTRDKSALGLVRQLVGSVVVVGFLFGGGLSAYDGWLAANVSSRFGSWIGFFVGLNVGASLLDLPFDAYATFRIEQRYGFNRMSVGLLFADWIKGLLLSTLLVVIVSAAGLALLSLSPEWYWLWIWCFIIGLATLLMLISPTVIEPLFIKTSVLDNPSLTQAVQHLADRIGVRVTTVLKMDASRRTTHSNAYFTGIGAVKRVVLFDTLLERLSESEVLAVLGHELGHWKLRHVSQRLLTTALAAFVSLYVAGRVLAWNGLPHWFGLSSATMPAQIIMLAFIASMLGFTITPLSAAWSRRHERQADDFAVRETGQPDALASALLKLARDNLANLHPHPVYAAFYYSHPPTIWRVRRLRKRE